MVLSRAYYCKLRHDVKSNPNEWADRSRSFARSLLASVAFRESAQATMDQTKSVILAPIGFYYALFHLAMAALWICIAQGILDTRNVSAWA